MKQYTHREFVKLVVKNGYTLNRVRGSHSIYINSAGNHISIPKNLECVIALKLIKENNLITDIKRK